MKSQHLILAVCTLTTIMSSLHAQSNEAPNRRRSFVSPEETIVQAWIQQGDQNGDAQLNLQEWTSVVLDWEQRLGIDSSSRISQAEFLNLMPALLTAGTSGRRTTSRSMLPNRFLGFFVALDSNRDGDLSFTEFSNQANTWFESWTKESQTSQLGVSVLLEGLRKAVPKTNMSGATGSESQGLRKDLPSPPPSPVLTPAESLDTMTLPAPFNMLLAASDPMIQEPVAMSFDADGTAYVVEMRSFMLDLDRSGERNPIGRISKLVDDNGDGVMDRSSVFIDGLIVPRAVLATHNGVLFVEDYTLQFAQDTNNDGHADLRLLIDASYGRSNIEHAPNGLMLAMDNWIYNGRSPWRYRLVDGKWVKEKTELRGQWGMTQDLHGRLFYNVNNSQLLGDFTPPNRMGRNKNYPSTAGLNLFIATDQSVYTRRMNTAVNRGYLPEVLDERGHLHVFASSCSPLIYRGNQFDPSFVGNAFVCDPAANIVKRNTVTESPLNLSATQAYDDREFIDSTDERFRPVNIYNGPDGTLWLLDMYRGVAQYGMFMTDYLRKETIARELDKGIHFGRMYRIIDPTRPRQRPSRLSRMENHQLVKQLEHNNGWTRDTAQRLLVERRDPSIIPLLQNLIKTSPHPVSVEHALWTLEGLLVAFKQAIPPTHRTVIVKEIDASLDLAPRPFAEEVWQSILQATHHGDPHVQVAAIRVADSLSRHSPERSASLLEQLESIAAKSNQNVVFQAALTAGNLPQPNSLPLMSDIAAKHADAYLIREAILSGLQDWELNFLQLLFTRPDWKEQQPGYAQLAESLAEAITASNNATQLDILLDLAANQSTTHPWRTLAVLTGIRGQLISSSTTPFVLNRKPAAFEQWNEMTTSPLADLMNDLADHLVWPGHPNYESALQAAKQRSNEGTDPTSDSEGGQLYQMICAGCHGASGEGVKAQAPPLRGSQWVEGSIERLTRIVLHGAQGPIRVGSQQYAPPEILAEMPPIAALDDTQIASILTFIRQAWGQDAKPVETSRILEIRQKTQDRQHPWTESELLQIP
ncbi:MAG: c-type cytochrome [Verrucomicrobiota bacterium]